MPESNVWSWLDKRPILVAIAGPNGAGKTTFFNVHIAGSGLRFINADQLAKELDLDAYSAARLADSIRRELFKQGVSYVFETVFSDPVGEKIEFLKTVAQSEYTVVLCFIGLSSVDLSEQRVAMRVSQGGHDVPISKLESRYPRTLANLKKAIVELPRVLVFDNSDMSDPFKLLAVFEQGIDTGNQSAMQQPTWLVQLLS